MTTPQRSAQELVESVLAVDPEHSFSLQPREGVTLCNEAARFIMAVLDVYLPRMVANEQHDWLASDEGRAHGWMRVDSETARQRAELGYPTLAVWKNPTSSPGNPAHGHIAVVIPAPTTNPGHLYVAAAGLNNTNSSPIEKQFGLSIQPDFFTTQ